MSNTDPTQNKTQKTKKLSNTDPTKNTTQKTTKMSNMDPTKNTTLKTKTMSNMNQTHKTKTRMNPGAGKFLCYNLIGSGWIEIFIIRKTSNY